MSDFNTTAEIWKWLLDGNKIKSELTDTIYFIKNGNLFPESIALNRMYQWSKYIEPKWYENIPKHGVIVKVSSGDFRLAIRYQNDRVLTKTGSNWFPDELKPLTNEEIKQFLLPD